MTKKKEKQEKEITSDSNIEILIHENGVPYREAQLPEVDKPIKLFNSNKPQRLEGETYTEYKIRQKLVKAAEKEIKLFYPSWNRIPYKKVKENEQK